MLWRAHFRYFRHHRWQLALAVLGIALGVGVVVAIDLANSSAERAFTLSNEALTGRATHRIKAGPDGIDDDLYRRLRLDAGVRDIAPVVEGYANVVDTPGRTLHIVGVDPYAEKPFRPYIEDVTAAGDLKRFLVEPATGLLLARTAAELGVSRGGRVRIDTGGKFHDLVIVGLLAPQLPLARESLADVVVTDIATAQELLGRPHRLSHIDVIAPQPQHVQALRALLPAGVRLDPAGAETQAMDQLTRAFRLNLTAMSLLALVVGMFLIYNTMSFNVVQRRPLFGNLRALGVSRGQILGLVSVEALLIGTAGTLCGLALGAWLAEALLKLVTRTINDLYFVVSVTEPVVTPFGIAKGVALGLLATLIAAIKPALDAADTPPRALLSRSSLEARARRALPRFTLLGVMAMIAGTLILLAPSKSLVLGFIGLFAVILGCAMLAPLATVALARLLRPLLGRGFGLFGRMAARGIEASLSRTGVAVAALVVAVAATVGVAVMVASLRHTVAYWLESSLRADVYVALPQDVTGAGIAPAVATRLQQVPGVTDVSSARRVKLPAAGVATELFVLHVPRHGFAGFALKQGDADAAWQAFQQGAVLISEPYAYRHDLKPGDRLRLPTDNGERAFVIAAVFYDYSSDQGVVAMERTTYERHWRDRRITSLGLYAAPGVDLDTVIERARRAAGTEQALLIRSNQGLRVASLAVFDRTFTVTAVLRLLAVLVAFAGVLSALMALQLDRAREIAVLRAIGLSRRAVWGLVLAETGLMGMIAGFLALPVGLILAVILISVINLRAFGWTMQLVVAPGVLVEAVALAVSAALLAGLYPARRMAATTPALALREQ